MSVLISADLHWSDNPRDDYRHAFVTWLVKACKDYKAEALFLLGDLTEAKDEHRAWLVNKVVDHLCALAKICPVIIIRGNHDCILPDWPFFGFVSHIENVYWINRPTHGGDGGPLDLDRSIGSYLMLPNTNDYGKDWDGINFENFDWIFTHNTFAGSDYGRGPLAIRGIPVEVFPKDAMVISGDIHVPQRVGPVRYVGAPYLVDFGDDYQPRIGMIEGDHLKFIHCDGPQKRLVEVSNLDDLKKVSVAPDDIVKVRVNLSQAEHARWPEIREAVKAWGIKAGVVVNTIQPMVIRSNGKSSDARMARAKRDDSAMVREYARQTKVDEATERTGIRLIRQG